MRSIRDAAILLILLLLVVSVRITPAERGSERIAKRESAESMPAIHLTAPACEESRSPYPGAGERSEPKAAHPSCAVQDMPRVQQRT
jgi:hypothetical protein